MKVFIKLTYDDRKKQFGNLQLFTHRKAIGIEGDQIKSVIKHFYPNPGDVKSLISAVPYGKGNYFVASIQVEGNETMVNTNKENLSILGKQLIDDDVKKVLSDLFEGATALNEKGLMPTRYCEAEYNWEDHQFQFVEGAIFTIDPSKIERRLKIASFEL